MAPHGPTSAFESETFGQDASFRLEQPVGAMSISPSGRDVVLGSKEGLHIIDLDSPYSPPRFLAHRTPWEVADVQWSPFAGRDNWVISTSNQKALVWNLAVKSWQDCIEFVLHGHTRAITDINFSARNPDVLATCAVDSFVHCWDLRAPLRPVNSFSDWFAGATQVKWSRQNEHVIASSHDKFLHIWDARNGARPVRTIEAHGTKIYGVDWNRHHPEKIVTCSLDRTIKFWNVDDELDVPERVIETSFPVWRARHTPFGWGLLVMPQRGNSDLHLYDRRPVDGKLVSGRVPPVATFPGHEGQVKEFLWRTRGDIVDDKDSRDFQLVTWGTDRELRLHALNTDVYTHVGYEKGVSRVQRLNLSRKGARYRTFRNDPDGLDSPAESTPVEEGFPRQSQFLRFRVRTSASVGMRKIPAAQFRTWVSGGRQGHKGGMYGRQTNRQSADPIAWLKNVKVSSWDPDTIADEIRHVGDKFKKVDFENVDISHRRATMSLSAPWGTEQSQVYLRVEMRFPKLYPRGANAILTLQKAGSLDDTTHKNLSTDLQTISETYASQKRGCLEAVLRYLLREQNLEQIVSWVLGESLASESKILDASVIPAEDSSSDDDDNIEGARQDRLDASANALVPIAKGCGALWSETGKLVCFFPAKSKEPVSFLSTLGVSELDENDDSGSKLFEGFGRLHSSPPARKGTNGARTADDDSNSDTSETSSQSSSSSSSSFETEQNGRGVNLHHTRISALQQRSRSPNKSDQSTTGGNKVTEPPRSSAISIHDFEELLPSKRWLAEKYQIFGEGHQICNHNAEIARRAHLDDLASVWTLVGLVLADCVPLQVVPHLSQATTENITAIARDSKKWHSSPSDVNGLLGKARWGKSPLGSTYLLPAIFDHFERLGDVQMLAMLSCVFATAQSQTSFASTTESQPMSTSGFKQSDNVHYFPTIEVADATLRNEQPPEGYVVVDSVSAAGLSNDPRFNLRRSFTLQSAASRKDSQLSHEPSIAGEDVGELAVPPSTNISVSTSPEGNRLSHRYNASIALSSARASLSALTQSYSGSPPSSSAAATIANSLKKYSPSGSLAPNWVGSGIWGSQVANRGSRLPSQGNELAIQDPRDTRSSISSMSFRQNSKDLLTQAHAVSSRRGSRSIATSDVSDHLRHSKPRGRSRKLRIHLLNQDKFDLDGYASIPLLDAALNHKCSIYRHAYANLLDVWLLPVQRAEMLKFDGFNSSQQSSRTSSVNRSASMTSDGPRRKTLSSDSQASDHGVNIRSCCHGCGEVLEPIEKNGKPIGWQCINQKCPITTLKTPKRATCIICCTTISGLAIPCLQCGHITCYDCAVGWFGPAKVKSSSRRSSDQSPLASPSVAGFDEPEAPTCPSGCGCPCETLTFSSAPAPPSPVQIGPPSPIVTRPSAIRRQSNGTHSLKGIQRASSIQAAGFSESPVTDPSLTAFLALTQNHARSRSTAMPNARSKRSSMSQPHTRGPSTGEASPIVPEDRGNGAVGLSGKDDANGTGQETDDAGVNPWVGSKLATLGRGIGAGLSRGLSSKASDATIRRVKQ